MSGPPDAVPVVGPDVAVQIVGVSTTATVVAVLSVIVSVAVLGVLFVQWYPRKVASDEPAAERGSRGPTDATYPPGSRPGGPGAEGMNVPGPGDISPGPAPPADSEHDADS